MTSKKDFIRGFDLYTLKGDEMYYFRSNLKYNLVKPHTKNVKEGQEKNKFKSLQYAFYLNPDMLPINLPKTILRTMNCYLVVGSD